MSDDAYYRLQDEIYDFCEEDLSPSKSIKKYESIHKKLTKQIDSNNKNVTSDYDYFSKLLTYHSERHQAGILFDDFETQIFSKPIIRVGILPIEFHSDDYLFIETLSKNMNKPIQEVADVIWDNKYATNLEIDLKTNQIQWLHLSFKELKATHIPSIIKLEKLNWFSLGYLCDFKDETLDFSKISNFDKHIKRFVLNSVKAKKIILTGSFEECEFSGIENVKELDCSQIDVRNTFSIKSTYCKNNGPCLITEAQSKYPGVLSKFRWKKEIIPTTKNEIDLLTQSYNWDNGLKFLLWAVKHPLCDKGTALTIYWLGTPLWFTQFSKKSEVDSWAQDNFTLLKTIEKRIKKDDFQSNDFVFNTKEYLTKNPLKYPENKKVDIPDYMLEI